MAIPSKEIPAFSESGTSTSACAKFYSTPSKRWLTFLDSSLLFAICLEAKTSGNESELRALAKDAAAHMKWVLREGNDYSSELVAQLEQHSVAAVKKWKAYRAMAELKKKFQTGSDLVQLMLEKQEPAVKRKREDELIEEIEELASLAKKLKEDRAKST
jgi:hypothetical protein